MTVSSCWSSQFLWDRLAMSPRGSVAAGLLYWSRSRTPRLTTSRLVSMPDAGQGNKGAGPSWTHGSGGCWAGGLPRPSNHGPSRATIRTHASAWHRLRVPKAGLSGDVEWGPWEWSGAEDVLSTVRSHIPPAISVEDARDLPGREEPRPGALEISLSGRGIPRTRGVQ